MTRFARPDQALKVLLLVLGLGLWGAVLVVTWGHAPRMIALALVVGTLAPVLLFLVGNVRLFMFVGTVFAATFGLSINFMLRKHMGGAPSFAIDVVDFFLFPLLAFQLRDLASGRAARNPACAVHWLWWGLIGLGTMSVIFGPFRSFAAFEVARMVKLWLLFVVVANEMVRERHFRWFVLSISAAVAVNVVIALLQFALKRELGLQALGEPAPEAVAGANYGVFLAAGAVYRVSGLMAHPNLMGAYLALVLPMLLAALLLPTSLRVRAWLGLVAMGGLLVLVLTLSRAAWAAFALALAIMLLFLLWRPAWTARRPLVRAGLVIAVPAGLLAAAPTVMQRIAVSDGGALQFRQQWADIAWQMILDRPLLGHGLNGFRIHIVDYAPYSTSRMSELFGEVWPVVHNGWLLVWAEQGSLGMLLFVALHLVLLRTAWRVLKQPSGPVVAMISLGGLCGILAIMVDSLASFSLRVPAPARVFWLVMAAIVAADRWNRRNAAVRTDAASLP